MLDFCNQLQFIPVMVGAENQKSVAGQFLTGIMLGLAVSASCALQPNLKGQGFANLDFEDSVIVSSNPTSYGFNTGTANVPGWTGYYGWQVINYSGGTSVGYNTETLDSANVTLLDPNYWRPAIAGNFTIFLKGGTVAVGQVYPWMTNGASIGQTGVIPSTTKSIIYWGSSDNNLLITFNGQALQFNAIDASADYTVYAADISAYAGQTGELLFNAPWVYGGGMIDNIQFSSTAVPEPSVMVLSGLSGLLLFLCRIKNYSSIRPG